MNQEVKMKPSYLKIAFLDRDGTIIKDYPDEKWREIKEPEFLEGSIDFIFLFTLGSSGL